MPFVSQTEMTECGLASLAMIAGYYGKHQELSDLRTYFNPGLQGMNLQDLIDVAHQLNLSSRPLKCPLSELIQLQTPCVLHWDMNHFVVLERIAGFKRKRVHLLDPAKGKRVLSIDEVSQHYTGICVEFTPTKEFTRQKASPTLHLSQLWSSVIGLKRNLTKLFSLSIALQVFALMSPYYMQWVVDEVVLSYDHALLTVLAIGFGLIVVLNVLTTTVRKWLLLRLSSMLNMQMGSNLFRHLMRLPMSFFSVRHVGDIVSRFGSLAYIRERITFGFIETLVDGLMSVSVLILMFLYSVKLTMIVVFAIAFYTLVRFTLYNPLHQAQQKLIETGAKEQSHFLESVRGIQTIKLFGKESQRQSIWQNRYAEVINHEIKLGRLNIGFEAFNKFLFGVENVLVIYFAAILVMQNVLSVGMLLAFMAYKGQLTQRFTNLIEQLIQFKMMRLHLSRISDIALHEPEHNTSHAHSDCKSETHAISHVIFEVRDAVYRYHQHDPYPVIDKLNLKVQRGQTIAITGASGSGKTTLMKLMLGLFKQDSGSVIYEGADITQLGLKNYRNSIATVMQDDALLAGSIADNICFFDEHVDFNKVQQVAMQAGIHEDIMSMNMTYQTLVGDMGSTLSGGQKQRILLARALYKQPSILFLDEATSHLDQQSEIAVAHAIRDLPITVIMIAHRQETINHADKVYQMQGGKLMLVSAHNQQMLLE